MLTRKLQPNGYAKVLKCLRQTFEVFIFVFFSRPDGRPFEVNSVIRLIDINYIDTVDFRFSVTAAFKFAWTDNRVERPADLKTGEMINLDLDFQKKLWMPDFYVNLF